jgi:AcrR family transcriptional regulator
MYNGVLMEGLRERKKRQTRDTIAAAALALFLERGYDSVTVADVAVAADVSEKTVFNYFPAKEDLVFANSDEKLSERAEALRSRPPGTPIARVFEAETLRLLAAIEAGEIDRMMTVPRLVRSSPALLGRLMLHWEHEAGTLTAAVTDDADDLIAAAAVRSLVWAHRVVFRAAMKRLIQGDDPADVARELRIEAERVYAQLDGGLAVYGA